jgi:hypothetical protein
MLMLITREPRPDFAHWPGRRLLAAFDALAWPLAVVAIVEALPRQAALVGGEVIAVAAFAGVLRLHRALWVNQRYRFTTWVWGKRLAALVLFGLLLKLALLLN